MGLYEELGPMALGSRLRRLSDRFYDAAKRTYGLYGVPLDPKWFPVFYVLSRQPEASTQEIADLVGHSHASISQITKAMAQAQMVSTTKSVADGRKNVLRLTSRGHLAALNIKPQYEDVGLAVNELFTETPQNLWLAMDDIERALDTKDFFSRVQEKHQGRRPQPVRLSGFQTEYAEAFKTINLAWIQEYFEVEAADLEYLDQPEEKIIAPGGYICFAFIGDEVVGTCAIIKMDAHTFGLAKMAVVPEAKGKRIGWLLGLACIEQAQRLGANAVYLESNRILEPAINLYRKLGFVEVPERPSPYTRADIYMELSLKN